MKLLQTGKLMTKKDSQVRTLTDIALPKRTESPGPTPEQGARLVRAFLGVKNSTVRDAIVSLVEQMSKALSDIA